MHARPPSLRRPAMRFYRHMGGRTTCTSREITGPKYALGLFTYSAERFQGFHDANILVLVDEASGVSEEVCERSAGDQRQHRCHIGTVHRPAQHDDRALFEGVSHQVGLLRAHHQHDPGGHTRLAHASHDICR